MSWNDEFKRNKKQNKIYKQHLRGNLKLAQNILIALLKQKRRFNQIASQFLKKQQLMQKEHAEIWFKLLHEGIPSTAEIKKDAAFGENYEWTDMYAQFAKDARAEGFDKIAALFEGVG